MSRIAAALVVLAALAGAASAADVERGVAVGGVTRSYLLHVPAGAPPDAPLALVLVLHGAGSNAWAVREQTGFAEEADWRGFAVAFPNGSSGEPSRLGAPPSLVWNAGDCCGFAAERGVDDVSFLREVIEDVARVAPIDRKRVFAAGMSNGGMMAYRLACEASDSFAAIGVVAGALVAPECGPVEPVSVIHLHGSEDSVVPLAGGRGRPDPPGFYPPAASAFAFWRGANGCDSRESASIPHHGFRLTRAVGCEEGAGVEFYEVAGGKHSWPGGSRPSLILPPSGPLAATSLIADFFATHPKPE
jgi:polyhydroxybutyrate depolymerase